MLGAIAGAASGLMNLAQGAYSIYSGQRAQDFAEDLAKKKYQWMVKDLNKAGLNPLLAVGGMSAGAPAMPPAAGFIPDAVGAGIQSASELAGVGEKEAHAKKMTAEEKVAEKALARVDAEIDLMNQQESVGRSQYFKNMQEAVTSGKQAMLYMQSFDKMQEEIALIRQQTREASARAGIAEADEAFYNSPEGRVFRALQRGSESISAVKDAASARGTAAREAQRIPEPPRTPPLPAQRVPAYLRRR